MPENNQLLSVESQLVGLPLAGPESFSQQQLDYLKRALGVDETVLFTGTTDIGLSKIGEYTLSEAAEHFERIRIYFARGANFYGDVVLEFDPNSGYDKIASLPCYDSNGTNMYTYFCSFTLSSSKFTELTGKCGYFQVINGASAGSNVNKTSNWLHPYKIVGIHRIAGGN